MGAPLEWGGPTQLSCSITWFVIHRWPPAYHAPDSPAGKTEKEDLGLKNYDLSGHYITWEPSKGPVSTGHMSSDLTREEEKTI